MPQEMKREHYETTEMWKERNQKARKQDSMWKYEYLKT